MKFYFILRAFEKLNFNSFYSWTEIREWTFNCGTSQIYRKKGQQKCKKTRGENQKIKFYFFQNNNK